MTEGDTTWHLFTGTGRGARPVELPEAPPWRSFPVTNAPRSQYQTYPELVTAINAAIYLRRPLLLTGPAGIGKSTVAEAIADELGLGSVLRWNVTSRSTLDDALYRYDALDRLRNNQLGKADEIERFVSLQSLGTALASPQVRVLLIDELDKSDIDLPGDLLNVLERGEFEIPELTRHSSRTVAVPVADSTETVEITDGKVTCMTFPIIVITSNGEREFPAAFLRRCIREHVAIPDAARLAQIVTSHLGPDLSAEAEALINDFADRINAPDRPASLAVDQLLNTVFLMTRAGVPGPDDREALIALLQRELRGN